MLSEEEAPPAGGDMELPGSISSPVSKPDDRSAAERRVQKKLEARKKEEEEEGKKQKQGAKVDRKEIAEEEKKEVPPAYGKKKSLSVFVGTWNMAGSMYRDSLDSFLHPAQEYDVYAIGSQECERSIAASFFVASKAEWEASVASSLGPNYVLMQSCTLMATHIVVFLKKELVDLASDVESASVATGLYNVIGNKGGVAVSLVLGSTSFLFVNAHFAAHQNKVAARNADFSRINSSLPLGRKWSDAPLACDRFDRVFWSGDLNYRINGNRGIVDHAMRQDMFEALVHNDQLRIERDRGHVFVGFSEGPLEFRPTYKLHPGSNSLYDMSKKARIPAWTDRILFIDREGTRLLRYTCDDTLLASDHLPVFAEFEVDIDATAPARVEGTGGSTVCVVS